MLLSEIKEESININNREKGLIDEVNILCSKSSAYGVRTIKGTIMKSKLRHCIFKKLRHQRQHSKLVLNSEQSKSISEDSLAPVRT